MIRVVLFKCFIFMQFTQLSSVAQWQMCLIIPPPLPWYLFVHRDTDRREWSDKLRLGSYQFSLGCNLHSLGLCTYRPDSFLRTGPSAAYLSPDPAPETMHFKDPLYAATEGTCWPGGQQHNPCDSPVSGEELLGSLFSAGEQDVAKGCLT